MSRMSAGHAACGKGGRKCPSSSPVYADISVASATSPTCAPAGAAHDEGGAGEAIQPFFARASVAHDAKGRRLRAAPILRQEHRRPLEAATSRWPLAHRSSTGARRHAHAHSCRHGARGFRMRARGPASPRPIAATRPAEVERDVGGRRRPGARGSGPSPWELCPIDSIRAVVRPKPIVPSAGKVSGLGPLGQACGVCGAPGAAAALQLPLLGAEPV